MNKEFGAHLRALRERRASSDPTFTLRQVSRLTGVEASYLSKIERGLQPPPGEQSIRALADVLDEDADVLLAIGGKISRDLHSVICRRPKLFASLLRTLRDAPDRAVLRVVREVTDGDW